MDRSSNNQIKILIVDDEKRTVNMLRMFLESENFSVAEAYTGSEGIKKACSGVPDLILLDIMLPDMTGYEVCNRLKKDPWVRSIPVIMLTGLSGIKKSDEKLGIEIGADDYIVKPFELDDLKTRIHAVLRRYGIKQDSPGSSI